MMFIERRADGVGAKTNSAKLSRVVVGVIANRPAIVDDASFDAVIDGLKADVQASALSGPLKAAFAVLFEMVKGSVEIVAPDQL